MISQAFAPTVLTVESIILLVLAFYLLYRYGDIRRQNIFVTALTLCIWFLSFFIVFLLPIDVSSAFYNDCLSSNTVSCNNSTASEGLSAGDNGSNCSLNCSNLVCSDSPLPPPKDVECSRRCPEGHYAFICQTPIKVLWMIINWLFTILTWTVLPLLQSYVMATYFSIKKKILRVIVENIIFYASLLVVSVVVLISLLAQHAITIDFVPTLVFTAVNTWGLLVLTVLLGYGLVEVPRSLWNASRRGWSLNYCYFKAAKLYSDMCEAADTLTEMKEKVCKLSHDVSYTDPMRKYVDLIVKKIPEDMRSEFSRGHDDFEDFAPENDVLTKKSLEKIYQKTIKAVRRKHRTAIEWVDLTDRALDLEDTAINATSGSRKFTSSTRKQKKGLIHSLVATLEWYWKVLLRHWVYRACAVILFLFSLIIVWSEATFGIPNVRLSIIAQIIYLGHNNTNYIIIELTSIVTVAYLSVCAYYTVFKIRIFNFYYLAPRHGTDEYSLLFSAMLLSRLAIPICLNYLYVINVVDLEHSRADVPTTAFQLALGNTDLIPWLTSGFNIYYPIIIALICLATFFKLGQRLLALFGYQTFIGEDEFSADYIDEGKALMKRERRNRERALGRGELRAMLQKGSIVDEILKEGERPTQRKPAETSNGERFVQSLKNFRNMKGLGKSARKYDSPLDVGVQYSRGGREGSEFDDDTVKLIPNDELGTSGRRSSLSSSHGSLMGPRRDLFGDL